jgi:hypothetical protein
MPVWRLLCFIMPDRFEMPASQQKERVKKTITRHQKTKKKKAKKEGTMKNIAIGSVNLFKCYFSPPLNRSQRIRCTQKLKLPTSPLN